MKTKFNYENWADEVVFSSNYDDFEFLDKDYVLELAIEEAFLHFFSFNFIDNDCPYFIVGFSGAMSNRSVNALPPFFSFKGISKSTNIPLLSVSDFTLYLNKNLKLSWYLGCYKSQNFQKIIARVIESFSKKYNKTPILCGGSGGGFASLAISSLLEIKNVAFVWNPQTDITKYYKRFVLDYIKTAFPHINHNEIREFSKYASDNDILYSLINGYSLSEKSTVLYLQNESDNHTEIHAFPFIEKYNFSLLNNYYIRDNYYVLVAQWGDGHVAPSQQLINYILKEISKDNCMDNIIFNLNILLG